MTTNTGEERANSKLSDTIGDCRPRNADVCAEVAGELIESLATTGLVASHHQLLPDNISQTIILESNANGDVGAATTWTEKNTNEIEKEKDEDEAKQQNKKINIEDNNNAVDNDGGVRCLRNWNDMPKYLQFNPYIRTGYRPITNFIGCIKSLFYLHNETVNIFTHGLATLHILLTIPNLLPWWNHGFFLGFISWCHMIGAVSPWIGSSIYHLFMNLNYGETFYKKLLMLDMLGIWVCQSVGAMPMITASLHCLPPILWYFGMLLYVFLSLWGLLKAMKAKSPWERRLCFSPPFMMRMIFLTLRCFRVSGGAPDGFPHVVLQDLMAVIGGSIGALRIPEKWIPGQVDFIFNSHNIMHVVVILAVWSMHAATLQDIKWMMNPSACLVNSNSVSQYDEL